MKGILLPTASGTSLFPITNGVTNHLLPIYPTPIMHEPISVLMLAGKSGMTNKK